jgi:hypothetical protein
MPCSVRSWIFGCTTRQSQQNPVLNTGRSSAWLRSRARAGRKEIAPVPPHLRSLPCTVTHITSITVLGWRMLMDGAGQRTASDGGGWRRARLTPTEVGRWTGRATSSTRLFPQGMEIVVIGSVSWCVLVMPNRLPRSCLLHIHITCHTKERYDTSVALIRSWRQSFSEGACFLIFLYCIMKVIHWISANSSCVGWSQICCW